MLAGVCQLPEAISRRLLVVMGEGLLFKGDVGMDGADERLMYVRRGNTATTDERNKPYRRASTRWEEKK